MPATSNTNGATKQASNGGRRRPDREGTEAALLDAALELIERDGILAGLNMQETADAAGVNRGLIHHYFGSRRALLRAALDRGLDTFRTRYERNRMRAPTEKAALNM